jgi:DNA-binding transcriptional LysR family regulator
MSPARTIIDRLSRIDLNLLLALKVLLETRNVTHAAEHLYITQSAMSRTLKRLRDLFSDPLLVRVSRNFVLTPKAEALLIPLLQLLNRLDDFIFSESFDPSVAKGEIKIAAPPYVMGDIIIKLTDSINREAPGLDIIAQNILGEYDPVNGHIEMLRIGMLDFAIFYERPEHADFKVETLQNVAMKYWMRRGPPLEILEHVSVRELFAYPVVVVNSPGIGSRRLLDVDRDLAGMGVRRRAALQTSSLLIALELVYRTDTMIIAVNNLSEFKLIQGRLVSRALPDDMPANKLENCFYMIQHRRTEFSPLHVWIGQKIKALAGTDNIHNGITV